MKMEHAIKASIEEFGCCEFKDPEEMKKLILSDEGKNKVHFISFRRFSAVAVAAIMALSLCVCALALSPAINIPYVERLLGVAPKAISKGDYTEVSPALHRQIEILNARRNEANQRGGDYELANPDTIVWAYESGKLSVADIYELFGESTPANENMEEALQLFPTIDEEIVDDTEEPPPESTESEPMDAFEQREAVSEALQKNATLAERDELSSFLQRLERGNTSSTANKEFPSEYRYTEPDLELISDKEKIEHLLSESKGENYRAYVLDMKTTSTGYKVYAAFTRLSEHEGKAVLMDENDNILYIYEGESFPLSALEAEEFMASLPKWEYQVEKAVSYMSTSTGLSKYHYNDNSFKIKKMNPLILLNPKNEFLYESDYLFTKPIIPRSTNGVAEPYVFDEMLSLGHCAIIDGGITNVKELYDFLESYKALSPTSLTVYSPSEILFFDATDPNSLGFTRTEYDFDSNVYISYKSFPTDFTLEDNVFTIHFGSEKTEFLLSENVIIY